ncbi:MAG TPA: hypothetical protein VE646_01325, partial [Actinomycetota bacterium]|nr:hypothetical protein [Actinomycetota bacterium]
MRPRHLRDEDLRRHLEAWVARELISTEEAEAIRAFEVGTAPSPRRVPLVTEVLAYLGAGLAIAAGV